MKIRYLLIAFTFAVMSSGSYSQNVGVNTNNPQGALDINGDIIIRPSALTVDDGTTLALDVNTSKFSYYRLTGPTADFVIAGITAGIDGRLITLFNRSGFVMLINNDDATAVATDRILTGTGLDITISDKGIVTLQYDEAEQRWIVRSNSKGGTTGGGSGNNWGVNGSDIYNTNSGNVGIGTSTPTSLLTLQTPLNTTGWTHVAGANEIIVNEAIGGVSASLGTMTNHPFRLKTNGIGRLHVYTGGEVIVGDNNTPSFGKFTVETLNNSYGLSHLGEAGNILATRMGGTSAGIGTFSNTNMRIFSNGISRIMIAASNGNVGIGTDNPTYKLSVLGNIRCTEAVVETGWADYVFEKNYQLPLLSDVEKFIHKNKHLPNIPSAKEIEEKGLHLGDTQRKMMEKIEELTLYIIQQQKEINDLKKILSKTN